MDIPYCVYTVSPFIFIFDKKLHLQSISKIKRYFLRKKYFFAKFGDAIVYL